MVFESNYESAYEGVTSAADWLSAARVSTDANNAKRGAVDCSTHLGQSMMLRVSHIGGIMLTSNKRGEITKDNAEQTSEEAYSTGRRLIYGL